MTDQTLDDIDHGRRRFLVTSTSVVGSVGILAAAVPFILSMEPTAATIAANQPIEVDISKLQPGQLITVSWRSRPIWILHRTPEQIKRLAAPNDELKDPDSSEPQQLAQFRNAYRSLKPDYFVAVGICTHLGCIPTYRPQIAPADLGNDWQGGFFCPCHGSRYDLSGRIMAGSPAPLNLPIPPYYYISDSVLKVGELKNGSEQNWAPQIW
jgi:ubiquinol-cytochrome c reductase iron-sulfur subunit